MNEIIDIKSRRKSKAPIDEPKVTVHEFLKELANDEEGLKDARGAVLLVWDENGEVDISHVNAAWMELLWYGNELMHYATEPDWEEDDE